MIVAAFIVVPLVELWVLFLVQDAVGWPIALAVVLVTGVVGAYLVRQQGRAAWEAIGATFQTGQFPGREMGHAALVLVGGAFLLTPGFLTDLAGFGLMIPPVREFARVRLTAWFMRRSVRI